LKGSNLRSAHLEKVDLCEAHFQGANLEYAHLEGADLLGAHLEGTHCCRVFFDAATRLNGVTLSDEKHGSASLADISWDNVNLAVVDWGHLPTLGDERVAHQKKDSQGKTKDKPTMVNEYKEAVRANRQLAVVL
jgi:hypothetical protein